MRAVVLVGGEGTRLRPLTFHTPKQMLRVIGFPMLERVLRRLRDFGVDEVVLSLGYQPDAFRLAYPTGEAAGVRLTYAVEEEPLDTAGAIRFAAESAGIDETFLVVNGDILTDLDVKDLMDFHLDRRSLATIGLVRVEDPSQFGVVVKDDQGRALRFVEKPSIETAPSHDINAGIYVLEPSALEMIPQRGRMSIERELFPRLVEEGNLFARAYECYWLDAGTPKNYYRAIRDILFGARIGELVPATSWYPAPNQPDDAHGHCYIGSAVELSSMSRVVGSVIEDGVEIAEGATVIDSIVLEGARVGPGAVVRGSIVGARTMVPEDVHLDDLAIVAESTELRPGDSLVGAGRL
ncbi:MAG: NDP-sugar synthase [Ferrimicrobium sp.]|uniref:NDP-sugar synthase n=1 Tax=Ferrimicrobium acidiphilum TaxID=121039 RepID=A0ABV3XZ34_9ACTN|nr:NDP-sugar synthase [Ferrimicrobium sp.]MCL5973626.1 NDP-sugar synthase [Actinomycetota bacterium]